MVINGQKQAKNSQKWPKMVFLPKNFELFRIFWQISFNTIRTWTYILSLNLSHWYRGHNWPKTGQNELKMAEIGIFFHEIIVILIFFAKLTQTSLKWDLYTHFEPFTLISWPKLAKNWPKTGQNGLKMAKIRIFFPEVLVIWNFFAKCSQSSVN